MKKNKKRLQVLFLSFKKREIKLDSTRRRYCSSGRAGGGQREKNKRRIREERTKAPRKPRRKAPEKASEKAPRKKRKKDPKKTRTKDQRKKMTC